MTALDDARRELALAQERGAEAASRGDRAAASRAAAQIVDARRRVNALTQLSTREGRRQRAATVVRQFTPGQQRGQAYAAGLNAALLGLPVYGEALLQSIRDRTPFAQELQFRQALLDEAAARRPLTAGAGGAAGVVATLPLATARSGAAAGQGARTLLSRVTGGAGRGATVGAVTGGISGVATEGARTADPGSAAIGGAQGALLGGAIGAPLGALAGAVEPVVARFAAPRTQAQRIVADQLRGVSREDIAATTDRLRRSLGREPVAAEVLEALPQPSGPAALESVRRIIASDAQAAATGERLVQQRTATRPSAVSNRLLPEQALAEPDFTGRTTTASMNAIRDTGLTDSGRRAFLGSVNREDLDKVVYNIAAPSTRQRVAAAIDGDTPLTVELLDVIRQEADGLRGSGGSFAFGRISEAARAAASDATGGAFDAVLRDFARNTVIEDLARRARISPQAAINIARQLNTDAELAVRLRKAGISQQRIDRLASAGRDIEAAQRGIQRVNPTPIPDQRAQEFAETVANVAGATQFPTMGGAGRAAFVARNARLFSLDKRTTERLVNGLLNPETSQRFMQQVVERLGRRRGELFVASVLGRGVGVGAGASQGLPQEAPPEAASGVATGVPADSELGAGIIEAARGGATPDERRAEAEQAIGIDEYDVPTLEQALVDADSAGDEEAVQFIADLLQQKLALQETQQ